MGPLVAQVILSVCIVPNSLFLLRCIMFLWWEEAFDDGKENDAKAPGLGAGCLAQAMSDHDLERGVVLERSRLEQRTRIARALQGRGPRTPESAMRAADRVVQEATDAVRVAERVVEKDRVYLAAIVQTMFGPQTRAQKDEGLRAWAEGLLAERQALLSGGGTEDDDEARLWNLAVMALDEKIKNKRVKSILADVVGRAERSAACEAAFQQASARLEAVEVHRAQLASAHVGCLDSAKALRLVEESRERLAVLEREWSRRGARISVPLVAEARERIERNRARAVQLRAAKRARLG